MAAFSLSLFQRTGVHKTVPVAKFVPRLVELKLLQIKLKIDFL